MRDVDPALLFGGNWRRLKDTFLLGAGDTYTAGTMGGSADAVVVRHTHTFAQISTSTGTGTPKNDFVAGSTASSGGADIGFVKPSNDSLYPYTISINGTGQSGTGKNMPPYLTVYMWERRPDNIITFYIQQAGTG
jgi:hypothetical protein